MNTKNVYFVMDPTDGGGPRNVFTLSALLDRYGYGSKVLSFTSKVSLNKFFDRKIRHNFYQADRLEPSFFLAIFNNAASLFNNVNYKNYLLFVLEQFFLHPITLSTFSKPDFYVATAWQSFFPALVTSRRYDKKLLYFVQADETEFSDNKLYKKKCAQTYYNDITKFTQSKWLVDEFESKFGVKLNHIGFGINHEMFYPRQVEISKVIFTIARSEKIKGFSVFVRAINRLWKIRQDFKVLIAGSNEKIIKNETIDFPYVYLGWIRDDNILAELYSASIFVNTGLNEALPMPPLEAMACGGTVVMTANGGSVEYTRNMENCVLVKPGDYKDLADKLDEILTSESLRESLRYGAIETAKKYNWSDVVENFIGLLRKEG